MSITKIRALDSESADIYEDAQNAAKAIMARRAELDEDGCADTPLFIAVGETHYCSSHMLHNSLLVQALAEYDEPIAVGVEQAHNFLYKSGAPVTPGMSWKEYGQATLKRAFSNGSTVEADLGHRYFLNTLLKHTEELDNFTAIFNDAASEERCLDLTDAETLEVYKTFFGDELPEDPINALSAEGAFLRNVFMADQLKRLSEKQNARIAIQFCGHGHVTGHKYWPVENSLAGCFNQMAVPFMALYMPHERMMANMDALNDDHKIISKRVPYIKTMYSTATGELNPAVPSDKLILDKEQPDITSRSGEQKYINDHLKNMGREDQQIHFRVK